MDPQYNWFMDAEGITVQVVIPGKPVMSTTLSWEDFGRVMRNGFEDNVKEDVTKCLG